MRFSISREQGNVIQNTCLKRPIEIFSIVLLDSEINIYKKVIICDFDNFLTKIKCQDHSEYHLKILFNGQQLFVKKLLT